MAPELQERQYSVSPISYARPWRRDLGGRITPEWSRQDSYNVPIRILAHFPTPLRTSHPKKIAVRVKKRLSPEERFNGLVSEWKASIRGQSLAAQIAMHPSYQSMIGMGDEALRFILKRLNDEQGKTGHWFWALAAITEENPVPKESRGNISEMARAWLNWGSERGYVKLD
jgi:hypothetical protein